MKRRILQFLTIIFLAQPALLVAKQGERLPALTVEQARQLRATHPQGLAVSKLQPQVKPAADAQALSQAPKKTAQTLSKPSVVQAPSKHKPVVKHDGYVAQPQQGQDPKSNNAPQESIKATRKRLTGYENIWQGVKSVALFPLTTSVTIGAQSTGLWGASALVNKVTGCQKWPWWTKPIPLIKTGEPLSQFSKGSFMRDVAYGLPQSITSALVTSAVDAAAYQAMKKAGLERYTFNSLIANSMHEKGYEGFVKDQKTLTRCQRIFSKIQQRMFKKIKVGMQEQKKQQLVELNQLSQEQIQELIEKELPDNLHKMLFDRAVAFLTPAERRDAHRSEKIKLIMVELFKEEANRPVSDSDIHAVMAQMPPEQMQELQKYIISTLSEKEQKLFRKAFIAGKIAQKQEVVQSIQSAQFWGGLLIKSQVVAALIGTPIAAWLLKSAFGWVTPTAQPVVQPAA